MYFSTGRTAMDPTFFKKSMFFLHFVGDVNAISRVHSRRRSRFFRGNTDFTQAVDSWQCIFQRVARQWIQPAMDRTGQA